MQNCHWAELTAKQIKVEYHKANFEAAFMSTRDVVPLIFTVLSHK